MTTAPTLPSSGVPTPRTARRRAIPCDCWRESWDAATRTVGGIALAVAVLALTRLAYPLGVLLLAWSQGAHP